MSKDDSEIYINRFPEFFGISCSDSEISSQEDTTSSGFSFSSGYTYETQKSSTHALSNSSMDIDIYGKGYLFDMTMNKDLFNFIEQKENFRNTFQINTKTFSMIIVTEKSKSLPGFFLVIEDITNNEHLTIAFHKATIPSIFINMGTSKFISLTKENNEIVLENLLFRMQEMHK